MPTRAKIQEIDKKASRAARAELLEELKSQHHRSDDSFRVMPETLDIEAKTVSLLATTNYPHRIWRFLEERLEISEDSIDLRRLKAGGMPLLKDHNNSVDFIIGRVEGYEILKSKNPPDEMADLGYSYQTIP